MRTIGFSLKIIYFIFYLSLLITIHENNRHYNCLNNGGINHHMIYDDRLLNGTSRKLVLKVPFNNY